jgi:hypothetical protein
MKFNFETKTDLLPEQIWPYYADVTKWFAWEDDLENITLNGTFETGTVGEMTLEGQPPMTFTLTEVQANQVFVDKTTIPNVGDVYFRHELSRKENQTYILHEVEFIPLNRLETAQDTEFVSQIFADVPHSVFNLIEAAK